ARDVASDVDRDLRLDADHPPAGERVPPPGRDQARIGQIADDVSLEPEASLDAGVVEADLPADPRRAAGEQTAPGPELRFDAAHETCVRHGARPITANTRCGSSSGSSGNRSRRSVASSASNRATRSGAMLAPTPALARTRPRQASCVYGTATSNEKLSIPSKPAIPSSRSKRG